MGLLDKARVLDQDADAVHSGSREEWARVAVAEFRHTPNHIDYPAGLFEAYKKVLGFTRGCLLFADAVQREFYPWIAEGLDRTTSRRLRIPFDFPPLLIEAEGGAIPVDLGHLAPMLSVREAGMADHPVITRIGTGGEPSALVLALDPGHGDASETDPSSAVDILNEALGDGIGQSRRFLVSEDGDEPIDPSEWLRAWGDQAAVLMILDISPAIDTLVDRIPGLELFRARRDMASLIRRITGRMGRACDMKDGRVLILFPAERLPDRGLYLHQLANAVATSVLALPSPPEFPAKFMAWPEEQDAVKAALSGFFPE